MAGIHQRTERTFPASSRFALASLALLLLAGGLTGVIANASTEKQRAQERYLSAVAPNTLR